MLTVILFEMAEFADFGDVERLLEILSFFSLELSVTVRLAAGPLFEIKGPNQSTPRTRPRPRRPSITSSINALGHSIHHDQSSPGLILQSSTNPQRCYCGPRASHNPSTVRIATRLGHRDELGYR